jgi:hypothetical protein
MSETRYKLGKSQPTSRKAKELDREKAIAKKLGGRAQPASGAGIHKGDVKLENFLLDSKACETNSLILPIKDVVRAVRDADGEGLVPALYITLEKVPDTVPTEWVMLPATTFQAMLDAGMDADIQGTQYD